MTLLRVHKASDGQAGRGAGSRAGLLVRAASVASVALFASVTSVALLVAPAAAEQTGVDSGGEDFKPMATATVGIEGRVLYRARGPRLMAREATRFAPVNVRIAAVTPDSADGTTVLYDLRFIGQREGRYDLRDALARVDGEALDDASFPPAPVAVTALLPPEHDGELIAMQDVSASPWGGYRAVMMGVVALWASVPIVWLVRRTIRRRGEARVEAAAPEPTLADLLAPLVERARAGTLDTAGRAALERLVHAHWREALGLGAVPTREALARIRADAHAGQLIEAVERWLHAPRPDAGSDGAREEAREAVRLLDAYRTPAMARGVEANGGRA